MWCLWSAKGGVGCSVMAAAAALLASRREPVLLVDLGGGDLSTILGVEVGSTGLVDWLAAPAPPVDSLARMELTVTHDLHLLCWQGAVPDGEIEGEVGATAGSESGRPVSESAERYRQLGLMLAEDRRTVVVDLGDLGRRWSSAESTARAAVLESARRSTLVSRLCYSAVTAALSQPRPDDMVLVAEPGRSLRPADVKTALGVEHVTTIRWDPAVARAGDAGLLISRLPRPLHRLRLQSHSQPHPQDRPVVAE